MWEIWPQATFPLTHAAVHFEDRYFAHSPVTFPTWNYKNTMATLKSPYNCISMHSRFPCMRWLNAAR